MLRYVVCLSVLTVCNAAVRASDVAASIAIENASFEAPTIDSNAFPAWPAIDGWIELDLDAGSQNTGVFANTATDSEDHMANADGRQLAFLGSQQGNALEQDLAAIYRVGCEYRLTVGVGVSARFPPSGIKPVDTIDLVLYYLDVNQPVDIVRLTIGSKGQSSTQVRDYTAVLATVRPGDAWAGKPIGVAIRATGSAGGFWDLDNVRLIELMPELDAVVNPSFESPAVDLTGFPVLPYMDGWKELDPDTLGSTNTGVFANTPADSWDHMANADGTQLAFLASATGNGLEQDLVAVYHEGCGYRLTAAVGISSRYPPSAEPPADTLVLVLYYRDGDTPVDIVSQTVEPAGLSSRRLQDFSVCLPPVQADDVWVGKPIGIALRSAGEAGGFWDLDNVRLAESLPLVQE
ncbi:MAG: hypothetical protein ABFD90_00575 [Phycisphaerales bacterium]